MTHLHNLWESLADELRRQGWDVKRTGMNHFRALPADKSKKLVFFSSSADPRAYHNTLTMLRKQGFDDSDSRSSTPPKATDLTDMAREVDEVVATVREERDMRNGSTNGTNGSSMLSESELIELSESYRRDAERVEKDRADLQEALAVAVAEVEKHKKHVQDLKRELEDTRHTLSDRDKVIDAREEEIRVLQREFTESMRPPGVGKDVVTALQTLAKSKTLSWEEAFEHLATKLEKAEKVVKLPKFVERAKESSSVELRKTVDVDDKAVLRALEKWPRVSGKFLAEKMDVDRESLIAKLHQLQRSGQVRKNAASQFSKNP